MSKRLTGGNPIYEKAVRHRERMKEEGLCGLEWPYYRRKNDFEEACEHKCIRAVHDGGAHKCGCGTTHKMNSNVKFIGLGRRVA